SCATPMQPSSSTLASASPPSASGSAIATFRPPSATPSSQTRPPTPRCEPGDGALISTNELPGGGLRGTELAQAYPLVFYGRYSRNPPILGARRWRIADDRPAVFKNVD